MQPASKQPPSKPSEQVALESCLLTLLRGIQNHSVVADEFDGVGKTRGFKAISMGDDPWADADGNRLPKRCLSERAALRPAV